MLFLKSAHLLRLMPQLIEMHTYVRDSFIRGIQSAEIRKRLLEECGNRRETFTNARTLELASVNSQQINNKSYLAAVPLSELSLAENIGLIGPFCAALTNSSAVSNIGYSVTQGWVVMLLVITLVIKMTPVVPALLVIMFVIAVKNLATFLSCKSTRSRFSSSNSYGNRPTSASMVTTTLSDAIIDFKVNGNNVKTLIDSGSSSSFIDDEVVKNLNLDINYSCKQSISMTSIPCI